MWGGREGSEGGGGRGGGGVWAVTWRGDILINRRNMRERDNWVAQSHFNPLKGELCSGAERGAAISRFFWGGNGAWMCVMCIFRVDPFSGWAPRFFHDKYGDSEGWFLNSVTLTLPISALNSTYTSQHNARKSKFSMYFGIHHTKKSVISPPPLHTLPCDALRNSWTSPYRSRELRVLKISKQNTLQFLSIFNCNFLASKSTPWVNCSSISRVLLSFNKRSVQKLWHPYHSAIRWETKNEAPQGRSITEEIRHLKQIRTITRREGATILVYGSLFIQCTKSSLCSAIASAVKHFSQWVNRTK